MNDSDGEVGATSAGLLSERWNRLSAAARTTVAALGTGIAYFVAALIGVQTALPPDGIVILWPPNAILLGALLIAPPARWWPFLATAIVAEIAADLPTYPPLAALGYGVVNCVEASLAAFLLRRFLARAPGLSGVRDFLVFAVAAPGVASAVAALLGAAIYRAGSDTVDYWHYWKIFWLGDATGLLIVGSAIMAWIGGDRRPAWPGTFRTGEAAALGAGLLTAAVFAFAAPGAGASQSVRAYLLFPFLLWAAARFGSRGASLALLAVAAFAITYAVKGLGPFTDLSNVEEVLVLQGLFAVVALSTLAIAFALEEVRRQARDLGREVAQRREAEEELRRSHDALETRVMDRTRELKDQVAHSEKMAEALQRSEARLRGAIESMQEGFLLFDADDRVVAINDVYRRINPLAQTYLDRGLSFEDLFRANVEGGRVAIPSGDKEAFIRERVARHFNPGPPIVRRFSGGTWYIIQETRTPEGGIAQTFTDITELKRAEEQLVQSSKLATLGEMASGIAHELNQPLTVVGIAAEAVLEHLQAGGTDRDLLLRNLKSIVQQRDRMAEIVNHMRQFSRKDTGAVVLERFDPVEPILGAQRLLAGQFRVAGIDVAADLPAAARLVHGHASQLEQVIINLFNNARDAVQERAKTADRKTYRPRVAVRLIDDSAAKNVVIAVADNGGGVPDQVMAHLFEPFFTTKASGFGTGLGLSISYSIVSAMGGSIEAHNRGDGTEFQIALPAAADQTRETATAPPAADGDPVGARPSPARRRVLIVDDEDAILEVMSEFLAGKGYEVVTARNGRDALDAQRARPADVVVTDMKMPEMSGLDLLGKLHQMAPDLPVVVWTGHTSFGDDRAVIASGAAAVLQKPVRLQELADTLARLLGRRAGASFKA